MCVVLLMDLFDITHERHCSCMCGTCRIYYLLSFIFHRIQNVNGNVQIHIQDDTIHIQIQNSHSKFDKYQWQFTCNTIYTCDMPYWYAGHDSFTWRCRESHFAATLCLRVTWLIYMHVVWDDSWTYRYMVVHMHSMPFLYESFYRKRALYLLDLFRKDTCNLRPIYLRHPILWIAFYHGLI